MMMKDENAQISCFSEVNKLFKWLIKKNLQVLCQLVT